MRFHYQLFSLVLVIFSLLAGCASDIPQSDSVSTGSETQSAQSIMNEATPYGTPAITQTYPRMNSPTQPPEDMVCMIDRKEQVFTGYNKYANAFNLVNPPMYINYTIPDTKSGSDGKYASYYTITVRDKNTGTVISQAGFGKDRFQGGYFDNQFGGYDLIRVMKSNDLLIESEGKDITIVSEIWVKPSGNLDSSFNIENTKCINWPQAYKAGVMHTPWTHGVMNVEIDRAE